MNCLPVTVTKAGTKRRRDSSLRRRADGGMDSLPDMFRANSGNGCSTAESGTVLAIPEKNLGKNVQRIGSEPLTPPEGNCGGSAAVPAGPPVGGSGSPAPAVSSPASASGPISSSTSETLIQPPQTTQIPPPPVISSPPSSSPTIQSSSIPAAVPPASASPAALPPVPGTTMGTCPTPGKSLCSPDGKAWGTCMENHQVIFQAIAQGTKCDAALGVEVPA